MDTLSAFMMGAVNAHRPLKVFDWDRAARLIKERQPQEARAGLSGDWEFTGGSIFQDGQPVTDDYTHLASTWAIPELDLDGEVVACWEWEHECSWSADTKWPDNALKILTDA